MGWGGRKGGRYSKGRGETGRGPAGAPLSLAGPHCAPKSPSGCRHRDYGSGSTWQESELNSVPTVGGKSPKPPHVPAQSHQNTGHHPKSTCPLQRSRCQQCPCPGTALLPSPGTDAWLRDRATQMGWVLGVCHPGWQCSHLQQHPCGCWAWRGCFQRGFNLPKNLLSVLSHELPEAGPPHTIPGP